MSIFPLLGSAIVFGFYSIIGKNEINLAFYDSIIIGG
jgi:hypothetical protein